MYTTKRTAMTNGRKGSNAASGTKNRTCASILDDFCNIPGDGGAWAVRFPTRRRVATVDLNGRWRRVLPLDGSSGGGCRRYRKLARVAPRHPRQEVA
jgi:hypothetical protein